MTRARCSIAAIATAWLSTSVFADVSTDNIVGTYELRMGSPQSSVYIQLDCKSDTDCTLLSRIDNKGKPPFEDKQVFKVHPVNDLARPSNALKYAIAQQSRVINNPEYAESMTKLRPVLAASPVIEKCWDLNYPTPGYMLACSLNNVPAGSPPIYLFGTLVASCGEAFCRYVINPMNRVR